MVAIFFADGFEEIEAVTVYDILKRAEIEVLAVGVGGLEIEGTHGLKITTDVEISDVDTENIDVAVLPGGMPGTKNLEGSVKLITLLKNLDLKGKRIGAICAAPSILGKLGMLEDREAICYPGFEKYLKGAMISRKSAVTDGNITTSKGPGTAIGFALELVRLLKGEKTAKVLASGLQYKEK